MHVVLSCATLKASQQQAPSMNLFCSSSNLASCSWQKHLAVQLAGAILHVLQKIQTLPQEQGFMYYLATTESFIQARLQAVDALIIG